MDVSRTRFVLLRILSALDSVRKSPTVSRAFQTTKSRVRRCIAEHALFPCPSRVLVAVSGGSDSVGMLGLLDSLRRSMGVELVVAHVHHRMRGEAADLDEACAEGAARKLGLLFVRCDLEAGLASGGNVEARARGQRYEALHRLAQTYGCKRIATGHTREDQAETFLLRLLRGSGPRGLAGIQPKRDDGVVRPVLECSREELENAAAELGLNWRLDESNADRRFRRNQIRHEIRPLLHAINPNADAVLAATAARLRDESAVVEGVIRPLAAAALAQGDLLIEPLRSYPMEVQRLLLRHWLHTVGISDVRRSSRLLALVAELLKDGRGQRRVRIDRDRWIIRTDRLSVQPDLQPRVGDAPLEIAPGSSVQWCGSFVWTIRTSASIPVEVECFPTDHGSAVADFDEIPPRLYIRQAQLGDRIRLHGSTGSKKLSDLFGEHKIPVSERWSHPVVCGNDDILWVPWIARSRLALVGPSTTRIIRFNAQRTSF